MMRICVYKKEKTIKHKIILIKKNIFSVQYQCRQSLRLVFIWFVLSTHEAVLIQSVFRFHHTNTGFVYLRLKRTLLQ